jgi:hypothetical protein
MKPADAVWGRALGVVMVLVACLYVVRFVPVGWVPHDEGMLGQAADRVLHGGVPHVDYDEPYTGGLTWAYAGVFKISGVDLVHIRWLLFAGAVAAACLTYAVLRRFLGPIAAAAGTWIAVGWSFPNYFAAIPSWWLLLCSLLCLWAVIRYTETSGLPWLLVAGAAAGLAVAIKQTGAYLLASLVLTLLYDGGEPETGSTLRVWLDRAARWGAGAVAVLAAALILWPRLFQAEGLYLFLPILACAAVLVAPHAPAVERPAPRPKLAALVIGLLAAALPVAVLLVPYVVRHQLWELADGLFILPRKRLAFASAPMPSAWWILTGVPLAAVMFSRRVARWAATSTVAQPLLWLVAVALPLLAFRYQASYQAVWQSTRAFAALAPVGICWRLGSAAEELSVPRRILFMLAATLPWMSLNQFPFAAPIYFSYVAPLGVVSAVASASMTAPFAPRILAPWAVMLLLFAVLITNRADLNTLGVQRAVRPQAVALNLARAHLKVSDQDVATYRRLVFTVSYHFHSGHLFAGPDCPEVYFLLGLFSPSGELFDFFAPGGLENTEPWTHSDVIVVNHAPEFSRPPSPRLLEALRQEFPEGQQIGRFEVRWR